MAVNLSPLGGAGAQFFNNSGVPLSGGLLYTYAAGTSTPAITYTSSNGVTPLANPIVLNAGGRIPTGEIWVTDGISYKFVLKDSTDTLIATWDNILGINSNFITFTSQEEVVTATQGQTVFTTSITYTVGTNNLSVFVNGSNQIVDTNYLETTGNSVTFLTGLNVGDVVKFTTVATVASNNTSSANVSYLPAGSSAVATNVQTKLRESVSVKDFGAKGDGATDDTITIQNAFDAGATFFPVGTYIISSALIIPVGLSIYGESRTGSIIKSSTAGINMIQASYTGAYPTLAENKISNLSFVANAANIVAISYTFASNVDIESCTFFGVKYSVYMSGGWYNSVLNCRSEGIGIYAPGGLYFTSPTSGSSSNYVFWLTVTNFKLYSGNGASSTAADAIYLNRVVGGQIRDIQFNSTSGANGIHLTGDCQGCTVDTYITTGQTSGIILDSTSSSTPSFTILNNCQIDSCTGTSYVNDTGSSYTTFSNFNITSGAGNIGVALNISALSYANIQGCIFGGFSTVNAINIGDSNFCLIQGNSFIGCNTGLAFFASNTYNNIDGNIFVSVTNPVAGTLSAIGNVVQSNNSGFSRTSYSISPAVPPTLTAYTNASGFSQRVYVTGGTVSNILINGQSTGVSSGSFLINVSETITLAYSVAPTWLWVAA